MLCFVVWKMSISILKEPVSWSLRWKQQICPKHWSVKYVALHPRWLYFQHLMLFTGFRKSLKSNWGTTVFKRVLSLYSFFQIWCAMYEGNTVNYAIWSYVKCYFITCQSAKWLCGSAVSPQNLSMEVLWCTYWATQWAAVKMCVLSISEPPQNCRPPLNRTAWIHTQMVVGHRRIQQFMCGES